MGPRDGGRGEGNGSFCDRGPNDPPRVIDACPHVRALILSRGDIVEVGRGSGDPGVILEELHEDELLGHEGALVVNGAACVGDRVSNVEEHPDARSGIRTIDENSTVPEQERVPFQDHVDRRAQQWVPWRQVLRRGIAGGRDEVLVEDDPLVARQE